MTLSITDSAFQLDVVLGQWMFSIVFCGRLTGGAASP
jgi:hypothetical protein